MNVWNWLTSDYGCVCVKKVGPETSTGIRLLPLDLQGLSRDKEGCTPEAYARTCTNEQLVERIQVLMGQLQTLCNLCQTKNRIRGGDEFQQHPHHRNTSSSISSKAELEVPSSMIRECASKLDTDMWQAQCEDWLLSTQEQSRLAAPLAVLSEQIQIRPAELEMEMESLGTSSFRLCLSLLPREHRPVLFVDVVPSRVGLSATELGVVLSKATLAQVINLDPSLVNVVCLGKAIQSSLAPTHESGLSIDTPALTISRLCGLGFETVIQGMNEWPLHHTC